MRITIRACTLGLLITAASTACTAQERAPAGVVFRDPRGLTLTVPAGWRATADQTTTRVTVTGPNHARFVVQPFAYGEPLDAELAAILLQRVASGALGRTTWGSITAQPRVVRLVGTRGAQTATCVLTWVNGPARAGVWLMCAESRPEDLASNQSRFVAIANSVQLRGMPAAAARARSEALTWTRFTDPNEQAFTLEVPRGWSMQGGTVRRAPVDVVAQWRLQSPDGLVQLRGGDAELLTFVHPSPALDLAGFREGSIYSPGYGVRMRVQRYMPAPVFVPWYATQQLQAAGCRDIRVTTQRDRSSDFAAINALHAQSQQAGVQTQLTGADVTLSCTRDGVPHQAYWFGTVLAVAAAGGGQWNIDQLYGYLAPASRASEAHATLVHAVGTFQLSAEWMRMQGNVTGNASRIVAQTSQQIADLSKQAFQARDAATTEASRQQSNAMLGIMDARDPVTGREFKVANAADYTWIDATGRIIGTNVDVKPQGVDVRQLFTW